MVDPQGLPRSAPTLGDDRLSGVEQSRTSVSERGLRLDFGILLEAMRSKVLYCRPSRPRASLLGVRNRVGGPLARQMLL